MHKAAHMLEQHFRTLVSDNESWKQMIAHDIRWELPYAPELGHPPSLEGREAVERHVGWFISAIENFRFHDLRILQGSDPNAAVAEVKAEGLIKATGRLYQQEYVVFLRTTGNKISYLREYFNPVPASYALAEPLRTHGI